MRCRADLSRVCRRICPGQNIFRRCLRRLDAVPGAQPKQNNLFQPIGEQLKPSRVAALCSPIVHRPRPLLKQKFISQAYSPGPFKTLARQNVAGNCLSCSKRVSRAPDNYYRARCTVVVEEHESFTKYSHPVLLRVPQAIGLALALCASAPFNLCPTRRLPSTSYPSIHLRCDLQIRPALPIFHHDDTADPARIQTLALFPLKCHQDALARMPSAAKITPINGKPDRHARYRASVHLSCTPERDREGHDARSPRYFRCAPMFCR